MTTSTIVDNKNIYFKVPKLTRIHGDPTYPQLQLLLNQIKYNAFLVQIYLGGGIYGHLGFVSRPEDYEEVSPGTPYERPLMPSPMRIPTNTKIYETQYLKSEFKGERQLYIETVDVDKALNKTIVSAIEKHSLK